MTTQMKHIDKQACKVLRTEIDRALAEVAKKFDIVLSCENMKYFHDGGSVEIKVKGAVKNSSGEVMTEERQAFLKLAQFDGLSPDDLGKSFKDLNGMTHTITGYRRKAHKKPITTRASDGKTYVWPASSVKTLLSRASSSQK